MIEIKGKTIIYTLPSNNTLGQVNPYLLIEKLEEQIIMTWPEIKVNKICANRKQSTHKIYCVLPTSFANEQIRLIKLQIELIASNLLFNLKEKIYFAGLAS